jgi:23S rRNA (pseudouridine1915-N3)-methyltransferase
MKTTVVAVGKVRDGHVRALCADYLKRARRLAPLDVVEVRDRKGDIEAEGKELLRALPAGATVVLLDERGDGPTSVELSGWLQTEADRGLKDLRLVIGGPYGISDAVRERARSSLRLSSLTLPHELARLVLLEQVYRAFTIARGLPYHHA